MKSQGVNITMKKWLTKNAVWLGTLEAIATIISVPMVFLSATGTIGQLVGDRDGFSGTWVVASNFDGETVDMKLRQ